MTIVDESVLTPGQLKTLNARTKRTRAKHERWAAEMREAGWKVTAPGRAQCCSDAHVTPPGGIVLHTLGCENRCAELTPYGNEEPYPCGATRGHDGQHWTPDSGLE